MDIAWGDDDFKPDTGDANGFGNDDGFDSFLAMQAPPAPQVLFYMNFIQFFAACVT